MVEKRRFEGQLWVQVQRAEDLPGVWLAHCLDLDVMSQGDSIPHAIEMIAEAVNMTLEHDLSTGRDPLDRRAPREFWDAFWALMRRGEKMPPDAPYPVDDSTVVAFLAQLHVAVEAVGLRHTLHSESDVAPLTLSISEVHAAA